MSCQVLVKLICLNLTDLIVRFVLACVLVECCSSACFYLIFSVWCPQSQSVPSLQVQATLPSPLFYLLQRTPAPPSCFGCFEVILFWLFLPVLAVGY